MRGPYWRIRLMAGLYLNISLRGISFTVGRR